MIRIATGYHIDWMTNFGSLGSPKIWTAFFSLVLWIAREEYKVTKINNLMDNTWGVDLRSNVIPFKNHQVPLKQAKLLALFDHICLPWEWEKQLWGYELEIIGHYVSCKDLSFCLEKSKRSELTAAIRAFVAKPTRPLIEWLKILGWSSWSLNSFPLGRSALQSSWDKTSGKNQRNAPVPISTEVKADLLWFADALDKWHRRLLLKSRLWSTFEANLIFFADACTTGLGVWFPMTKVGYSYSFPPPSRHIYWAELVAVAAGLDLALLINPDKVAAYSDSMLTVQLFSLHSPSINVRLAFRHVVNRLLETNVDLKVVHIPGELNIKADALSRGCLDIVKRRHPTATFHPLPVPADLRSGGFTPSKKPTSQSKKWAKRQHAPPTSS